MSFTSYLKPVSAVLFAAAIGFSGNAFAVGKIISQKDAIEASQIHVFISSASKGTARINGCEDCPVVLNIDGNTEFFFENKPARDRQVTFLSGKPGTVIYDKASKLITRIRW